MTVETGQLEKKQSKQESWFQRFWLSIPLQTRLTFFTIVVSTFVLITVIGYISYRAGIIIEDYQYRSLQNINASLTSNTNSWLMLNEQSLIELAQLPDVMSMFPSQQKTVMHEMASAFPNVLFVHTMNLLGKDLARSDTQPLSDYHDQEWFINAKAGRVISLQSSIDTSTGKSYLSMGAPIRNAVGDIVGVAGVSYDLSKVSQDIFTIDVSGIGFAYVLDYDNRIVARSDPNFTESSLGLTSAYVPVTMLRKGSRGLISFSDGTGTLWRANVSTLPNGWGIIVQEPESAFLAPVRAFQEVAALLAVAGVLLMFLLARLTIRRTLQPIENLTQTATAIAGGDLNQNVIVESQDEVGKLATAFNQMTLQIRNMIGTLEQRVSERTRDLERRSAEIQTAAQIARDTSVAQNANTMFERAVHLIRERFGYYHVGVFIVDDNQEYAVLQAASSDAGKLMLANKHRLKIGETGIVGYVAQQGEPRIALDVGVDSVHFQNPLLPYTRSEMALPLRSGTRVIGVLDIQSDKINAFDQSDVSIFQIITDQMSVAYERTNLVQELQQSTSVMEQALAENITKSWRLSMARGARNYGYKFEGVTVEPISDITKETPISISNANNTSSLDTFEKNVGRLNVPIQVRGQKIGMLNLRFKNLEISEDTTHLVEEAANRLALALENARLVQNAQSFASREQQIGVISAQIQQSTDLNKVMQNTIRELGVALGVPNTFIQIGLSSMGDTGDQKNRS